MKLELVHWLILFGLLLLLSLALCQQARADTPRTVGIVEGETAPFAGVLVDPDTFAGFMHERLDLDEERVRAQQCLRYVDSVNEALSGVLEKRAWYDSPAFRTVAGFALGAAVVIVAYEGANRQCCPP